MGNPKDTERSTTRAQKGLPEKRKSSDARAVFEETVAERSRFVDALDEENFRASPRQKIDGRMKIRAADLGTMIDKYWDELVPESKIPPGLPKQQRVYTTSNDLFIDAIDRKAGIIHEIKPHSSVPTKSGARPTGFGQAENYANLMDTQEPLPGGRKWKVSVHYYNKSDVARLALSKGMINEEDFAALPEEWRRAAPKPGDVPIRTRAKPVRRMTKEYRIAQRDMPPRIPRRKLHSILGGPHPIVSAVYELSGASDIVGGWADSASDLIHGTGRLTAVDKAVLRAAPAIAAEFELLQQRDLRNALWTAYAQGREQLYAVQVTRVTAIVTQATLGVIGVGSKFDHDSIFSIVPQLMENYFSTDEPPSVGPADDNKTSGVTNENRARLAKAGLYKGPPYGLPGNEFRPDPFMDARSAQVTLYIVRRRVDLGALRATLGPLTGAWYELSVAGKTGSSFARSKQSQLALAPELSHAQLVDSLASEFVFRQTGSGIAVRGRRKVASEDGKQRELQAYQVKRVTWDAKRRALRMTCDVTAHVRVVFDLAQVDESVMAGTVVHHRVDEQSGHRLAPEPPQYVVFRRPPGFNVLHHLSPDVNVTKTDGAPNHGEAMMVVGE